MFLLLLFQNANQVFGNTAENSNQAAAEKVLSASQNATRTVIEMINGFWAQLPVIAVGIVVFFIFLGIAYGVRKIIRIAAERAHIDQSLTSLLARSGFFLIIIFGIFVALVVIFPGISPGDLFAGLGIGSVALGFAFKDILQNLFAGFLILLYRPFHIGDQIKLKDFEGTIEEINIRATKMKTYDGDRVVIPNSDLYMNSVLVRTAFPYRRIKFIFGIGYNESLADVKRMILQLLQTTEGVLSDPAPDVDVLELADSAVNLRALFWTKSVQSETRKTRSRVVQAIKEKLDAEGIEIPFPYRVLVSENGAPDVEVHE